MPHPSSLFPRDEDPQRVAVPEGVPPALPNVQLAVQASELGGEGGLQAGVVRFVEKDRAAREKRLGRAEVPIRALDPSGVRGGLGGPLRTRGEGDQSQQDTENQ